MGGRLTGLGESGRVQRGAARHREPGAGLLRRAAGLALDPGARRVQARALEHPHLAARADRRQDGVRPVADQHEHQAVPGLLQRLQQGVGGHGVHRVGRVDQHHATPAAVAADVQELGQRPHLIDLDLATDLAFVVDRQRQHAQVGMGAGAAPAAGVALPAGAAVWRWRLAQQRGRERSGVAGLPDPRRAQQQQRVRQAVEPRELGAKHLGMPRKFLFNHWVAACFECVGRSQRCARSASSSTRIESIVLAPSIRRNRSGDRAARSR